MGVRNYSNLAANTTVSATVPTAAPGASTAITVGDLTGWPSAPFTAAIERGTAAEEIVLVTSVTGQVLTCQRGFDATQPVAHALGSVFEHVTAALDYTEANAHVNATGGAHVDLNSRYLAPRIQASDSHMLSSAADVTLAPFKVGPDTGSQILVDGNNIQSNSAANTPAALYLNPFGGGAYVGGTSEDYLLRPGSFTASVMRSATTLTQGGVISVSAGHELSWSARMVTMGQGAAPWFATAGYFEVIQPPAGTVVPVHNDSPTSPYGSQTATSGGVPIPSWCALYYELPLGSGQTSQPGNFHLVDYRGTGFTPSAHWVKIAQRNDSDDIVLVAGRYPMRPGSKVNSTWGYEDFHDIGSAGSPGFLHGWGSYNAGYAPAGYLIDVTGTVYLRGLVKGGTLGSDASAAVFTLPAGYRPEYRTMFASVANGVLARVDVLTDGSVCVVSGSTIWTGLDVVRFKAFQ